MRFRLSQGAEALVVIYLVLAAWSLFLGHISGAFSGRDPVSLKAFYTYSAVFALMPILVMLVHRSIKAGRNSQ